MPPDIKIPDNSEIEKALKEFEMQSEQQVQRSPEVLGVYNAPQKKVSGIEFQTDSYRMAKSSTGTDVPKMVRLVMKLSGGAIKEQKTAEHVLLGIALLMFLASFYFFFH